ncbi:hypothetical protein ACFLWO_00010 [Chloroflexota bacterium]
MAFQAILFGDDFARKKKLVVYMSNYLEGAGGQGDRLLNGVFSVISINMLL